MAKPRQATAVIISRKLQLKWRSFSAIVRLTLPEPLENEEKLAMPNLPRPAGAPGAGAPDREAGIPAGCHERWGLRIAHRPSRARPRPSRRSAAAVPVRRR